MKYPASIRCCNIEPNGPIIYNENRLIHLHPSTFHYFEGINSSILSSKPRKISLDLLIGSKYLKFDSNEIQTRFPRRFFHRSGSNIEKTLRVTISLVHTFSCNRNEYRRSISIEAITLLFIEQRKELKKVFSMIILRIHKNFSNHNLSRIVEGDRSSVSQRQEDTLERWRKGGMEKWRESFVWPSFKKL